MVGKYEKFSKLEKAEKPIKLVLKMGGSSSCKEQVVSKDGKEKSLIKVTMDKAKDHSKKKKKKGKDRDKKKHKHESSLVCTL